MALSLKDVELQAQQLTPNDRARLAEVLLESLQEPSVHEIEAEWETEIIARIEAWKNGTTSLHTATDVLAEARKICR